MFDTPNYKNAELLLDLEATREHCWEFLQGKKLAILHVHDDPFVLRYFQQQS